jgi:uncharacterized delta-60 repeat protein
MLLGSSLAAHAQTAVEAWVRRYSSTEASSQDYARKVATDADGNVIVAGDSDDGITGVDILIIKYSGAGVPLWTNRYNAPASTDDHVSDVAIDRQGNVVVTGYSYSSVPPEEYNDYLTVAYSPAGVLLWANSYAGPSNGFDRSYAVAVDDDGNVVVTGSSGDDYATIKYSGSGVALWTNRYDGRGDGFGGGNDVSIDTAGNIFVTGASGGDYATIAYSGAGVLLWTNLYAGPGNAQDSATVIAIDNTGKVFVTGSSFLSGDYSHSATIAYSSAGVALWTNYYNVLGSLGVSPPALAVADNGNVFVAGYAYHPVSTNQGTYDYVTIAYSGAGLALWTNSYGGPANGFDRAYAIAVDYDGNVLVTGSSGDDYATIKYSGSGAAIWTNRYAGLAHSADEATGVSVDSHGNVFVTGSSQGDYVTVAYSATGVGVWTNHYNGSRNSADRAVALALGHNGNVIVAGSSSGSGPNDYVTVAYSASGVALWTNRYNGRGNSFDYVKGIAVDHNDNVVVTGSSSATGGEPNNYATIAYSASGVSLWTNQYDSPLADYAVALTVDGRGNVFVTGYSAPYMFDDAHISIAGYSRADYATIAYSHAGIALWTNWYNGPGNDIDFACAVAANDTGNVFVTGSSYGGPTDEDYATVAYSGGGVALWTNRYNGPGNTSDRATALVVDRQGNAFVTGYSLSFGRNFGYATVAYSPTGDALWTNRYMGPVNGRDTATAIAVDRNGNVLVTGHSPGVGTALDYATVAYSSAGVPLWTNRYNGTGNANDEANAVAVDNSGYVFVTGRSVGSRSGYDYVTIAYSAAGVAIWTNRYDGPASGPDEPGLGACLAVGRDGAVYVTGSSDAHLGSYSISDYATIKYVWRPHLSVQPLTTSTVNLNVSGPPNSSWAIERALMISGPWTNLGLSLIEANGSGTFEDANPLARGAFYRAAQP